MNHEFYKTSRNQRLKVLLTGYIAAFIYLLCYLIARKAHMVFDLPGPISEAAAMTIASFMTLPIFLPFIYERLTKVKILASKNIELEKVYQAVSEIPVPDEAQNFNSRVAWIAQNFKWHLDSQFVEEDAKENVTRDFLLANLEMGHGLIWNGDPPTLSLLRSIVEYPNSFVPLTKSNGQLNTIIDRELIVDHLAESYLKQKFS